MRFFTGDYEEFKYNLVPVADVENAYFLHCAANDLHGIRPKVQRCLIKSYTTSIKMLQQHFYTIQNKTDQYDKLPDEYNDTFVQLANEPRNQWCQILANQFLRLTYTVEPDKSKDFFVRVDDVSRSYATFCQRYGVFYAPTKLRYFIGETFCGHKHSARKIGAEKHVKV